MTEDRLESLFWRGFPAQRRAEEEGRKAVEVGVLAGDSMC
jgi:hypothetical protein